MNAIAPNNNMSIPALHNSLCFMILTSDCVYLPAFSNGSPDRVSFDPDGLNRTEQKYVHTYKIKYKIKKI